MSTRWTRILAAIALVAIAVLVRVYAPTSEAPPQGPSGSVSGAAEAAHREVVVNLFQWSWASVAAECPRLAQAGYGGVQISPAQEHVVVEGMPWWVDYQPVSYQIASRRGDRAAFAAMVGACHAAGVRVYADAVINHMAGGDSGTGWAGSTWEHYTYPGIYQPQDFHHCGLAANDDISDYGSRGQVQTCELVNLADLATDTEYVRTRLAAYLDDLGSLGVDGLRVDAAKHIPAADLAAILARARTRFDVYQEVIDKGGEAVSAGEYVGTGRVLVFTYGDQVGQAFQWGALASLKSLGGPVASDQARVFLDNHDTQRHGGPQVLTHANPNPRVYALATVFMLAYPYGEPVVMSSYAFTDPDAGPPTADARGTTKATVCGQDGWVCEHRVPAVVGMVGFHNAVAGTGADLWWDDGSSAVAFARGDKGYVVVNNEAATLSGRSFQTHLPAGTYCDVVHGTLENGRCTGPSVTVNADGWFTATVAPVDALAIHVAARAS